MNIERAFGRTVTRPGTSSALKRHWTKFAACLFLGMFDAAAAEEMDEGARALFVLEPIFELLDCTQQGFIEGGEVDEHFFHLFAPYDPDRKQWAAKRSFVRASDPAERRFEEDLFAAMDTNGDQKVSATEYRDHILYLIRIADGDGDGEVTMDELRAIQADD